MAVKETPEAEKRKKEAKTNKGDDLTTLDTVVLNAKCYKKTIALGTGTAICIIGSQVLNKKNQALLATAYPVLEQSYKQYKDKVKELFGIDAHRKVEEEIAKDAMKANPPYISAPGCFMSSSLDISDSEDPELIRTFYDTNSKRYFESTYANVLQAQYHVNRNYVLGKEVSENEYYEFLGIPGVEGGDERFWYIYDDYADVGWIDFDNHVATVDDMEVIIIDMQYTPHVIGDDQW